MSQAETSNQDATEELGTQNSRHRLFKNDQWRRNWKRSLGWFAAGSAVIGICLLIRTGQGDNELAAQSTANSKSAPTRHESAGGATGESLPRVGRPKHDVMAIVNRQDISRRDLIDACVRRHGEEVLESLVNKQLIMNHCEKRGITVTSEEINAEVDRMAKRFKLGREQWFEMLEKERDLTPQEYARDVVWPTLALRKLAANKLEVSDDEVRRAFDAQFGPMVRARLIAIDNEKQAQQLHQQLVAEPNRFARLAMDYSKDVNSASMGGLIQPIRHNVGDPEIERVAFNLQPGQLSPIIPVAGQFVILKCEEHLPARGVSTAEVREKLIEKIKEQKLRKVAHTLFSQLQSTATIQNVYNDAKLRETMPGVVATVNGDRITMLELGHECLLRNGEEVLEIEISHLLLEQALKQQQLTLTEADLEAEVRHAAKLAGMVDEQDRVDLQKWFEAIETEQKVSRQQYMRDAVWPSAALKKLTAGSIQVDQADINKGFEANYGERVRCQAIVLGNMRRAQEVWDKARQNPTPEYFGDLAEQYSIEPTSKSLRGEVPPIQHYGGQQQLEEVAFGLQDGQLSGIVQMGDKFIILRCEGRTERIEVDRDEVRDILAQDIYEKKLRMAMSDKFEAIRERSRIDNYLAGTSHAPVEKARGREQANPTAQAKLRHDTAVLPAGVRN